MPFADRIIGNLQQRLVDTYRGVSKGAVLRVCLDEFLFLEGVDRKLLQVGQARVSRAEIIKRQLHTQILESAKRLLQTHANAIEKPRMAKLDGRDVHGHGCKPQARSLEEQGTDEYPHFARIAVYRIEHHTEDAQAVSSTPLIVVNQRPTVHAGNLLRFKSSTRIDHELE